MWFELKIMAQLRQLFVAFLLCGAAESSLLCERNVEGKPYSTVTFTCHLGGGRPQDIVAVTWKKGDDVVAQAVSGKQRWKREVAGDPRAELIEEELQKGDVSLHLKDVDYADQGSYHCTKFEISNKFPGNGRALSSCLSRSLRCPKWSSTQRPASLPVFRLAALHLQSQRGEDGESNQEYHHSWKDRALDLFHRKKTLAVAVLE
ncbi:butyrophilin subfamily 1 member A1-like [Huso huso]|uniref:Butyrophilin subfamily 1 member A1-like n=1 Tax=Huso huso TaxID=61971 RepID=A0ABR0Y2M4_HUSHU